MRSGLSLSFIRYFSIANYCLFTPIDCFSTVSRDRNRLIPSTSLMLSKTFSKGKYTTRISGHTDEFSDAVEKPTVVDIKTEPINETYGQGGDQ